VLPASAIRTPFVARASYGGNQDNAFENLAADRLGLNRTDLHCLNAIENAGGLSAGELAPRQASPAAP
jgi:hypothetical protein